MSLLLMKIHNLIEGTVLKRPSKIIKSPYVADILEINEKKSVLGHTASLGCCGLADNGASILMSPVPKSNKKKDVASSSNTIFLCMGMKRTRFGFKFLIEIKN